MSTTQSVPWDIEERVEDALVAYIKTSKTAAALVVAAYEYIKASYPLIVVQAVSSDNPTDTELFTGRRRMPVTVALVTQVVGEDEQLTARESHRRVKDGVVRCLAGSLLHERLNEIGAEGVEFSQAHMTALDRDAGDGKLTTEIMLDVIAQPKEI